MIAVGKSKSKKTRNLHALNAIQRSSAGPMKDKKDKRKQNGNRNELYGEEDIPDARSDTGSEGDGEADLYSEDETPDSEE